MSPDFYEDLTNVAKMKFHIFLILLEKEPKKLTDCFLRFCDKGSEMFFEVISSFAKGYLQSQIMEYDIAFRRNDFYESSVQIHIVISSFKQKASHCFKNEETRTFLLDKVKINKRLLFYRRFIRSLCDQDMF